MFEHIVRLINRHVLFRFSWRYADVIGPYPHDGT
jgi:hypothetical protein